MGGEIQRVAEGEAIAVLAALHSNVRWATHTRESHNDPLVRGFAVLRETLIHRGDGIEVDTLVSPFLEVVCSGVATGTIASVALNSLHKLISYNFIRPTSPRAAEGVNRIAYAVTQARFVCTDFQAEEVVLMRIVQVLKALLCGDAGRLLSHDRVKTMLETAFKLCFQEHVSEVLGQYAETAVQEMVLHLFSRLTDLSDDYSEADDDGSHSAVGASERLRSHTPTLLPEGKTTVHAGQAAGTPQQQQLEDDGGAVAEEMKLAGRDEAQRKASPVEDSTARQAADVAETTHDTSQSESEQKAASSAEAARTQAAAARMNARGVTFEAKPPPGKETVTTPYTVSCVADVLRHLCTLIDMSHPKNTPRQLKMGLATIITIMETSAHNLHIHPAIMQVVEDDLCHQLLHMLDTDDFVLFSDALRALYLLMQAQGMRLKFQLERLLLILVEDQLPTYEHAEAVLDCLLSLFRIPSFVHDLFFNFDCDLFSEDLVERLLLFLQTSAATEDQTLLITNMLALETLLTIARQINNNGMRVKEQNWRSPASHHDPMHPPHGEAHTVGGHVTESKAYGASSSSSSRTSSRLGRVRGREAGVVGEGFDSGDDNDEDAPESINDILVSELRARKKTLEDGIELFNQKPKKGIVFLRENGLLRRSPDAAEVADLLKSSPRFDKARVGEYIGDLRESDVREAFIASFNFEYSHIDEALRSLLTSFRLPGEAQVIERILECFASRWMSSSKHTEHVQSADAACVLAYAIIMLNVDQHSPKVARKMTVNDFVRNLRGANDKENFPRPFLERVYKNINSNEIVLPEEHEGDMREQALWEALVARSRLPTSHMTHVHGTSRFDAAIFTMLSGPLKASLAFILDVADEKKILRQVMSGYILLGSLCSRFDSTDTLDTVVQTLSKRTYLLDLTDRANGKALMSAISSDTKAQLCLACVFDLCIKFGDTMEEGWSAAMILIQAIARHRLLPAGLRTLFDFVQEGGRVRYFEPSTAPSDTGADTSVFSFKAFSALFASAPAEQQHSPLQQLCEEARQAIEGTRLDRLFESTTFLSRNKLRAVVRLLAFCARGPRHREHDKRAAAEGQSGTLSEAASCPTSLHASTDQRAKQSSTEAAHADAGAEDSSSGRKADSNDNSDSSKGSDGEADRAVTSGTQASEGGRSQSASITETAAGKGRARDHRARAIPRPKFSYTQDAAVFFLEMLSNVVIYNRARVDCVWGSVVQHFMDALGHIKATPEVRESYLAERTAVCVLRLAFHFLPQQQQLEPSPVDFLTVLCDMESHAGVQKQIARGLFDVVQGRGDCIGSEHAWDVVFCLLEGCGSSDEANELALDTLWQIASSLSAANGPGLARTLLSLAEMRSKPPPPPAHEVQGQGLAGPEDAVGHALLRVAVTAFRSVWRVYPRSATGGDDAEGARAWQAEEVDAMWDGVLETLMQVLTDLCASWNGKVRQEARDAFHQACCDPHLACLAPRHWGRLVERVMIPLLQRLNDTTTRTVRPRALAELRDTYGSQLSRVFRQRLSQLCELDRFQEIWAQVVQTLLALYENGHEDVVRESLKIILLLMSSKGIFEAPRTGPKLMAWTERYVSSYSPGLYASLFDEDMHPRHLAPGSGSGGAGTGAGSTSTNTSGSASSAPNDLAPATRDQADERPPHGTATVPASATTTMTMTTPTPSASASTAAVMQHEQQQQQQQQQQQDEERAESQPQAVQDYTSPTRGGTHEKLPSTPPHDAVPHSYVDEDGNVVVPRAGVLRTPQGLPDLRLHSMPYHGTHRSASSSPLRSTGGASQVAASTSLSSSPGRARGGSIPFDPQTHMYQQQPQQQQQQQEGRIPPPPASWPLTGDSARPAPAPPSSSPSSAAEARQSGGVGLTSAPSWRSPSAQPLHPQGDNGETASARASSTGSSQAPSSASATEPASEVDARARAALASNAAARHLAEQQIKRV